MLTVQSHAHGFLHYRAWPTPLELVETGVIDWKAIQKPEWQPVD